MRAKKLSITIPEHHDVTVRYLDGKIGRVLPTAEILSMIEALPNS